MKKKYEIRIIREYSKDFVIEAESEEEAEDIIYMDENNIYYDGDNLDCDSSDTDIIVLGEVE